ncbi:uncharacterized protein LOC127799028 isoform X1 [Diospyros lotus]|uniref:uncharacterized protein LOC127799028 isoform X1 n=1 Tax=Diospyros lotus TaxID=55363 RepID=UPI002259E4CE|nr:uncharacterized protein LOC127799028 isoform X1 [Diospyros lotus]
MFQLVNCKPFNPLLKGTDVGWYRIPTSTVTTPNHLCVRLDNGNKYAMRPLFSLRPHTNHGYGSERTPDILDNTVDGGSLIRKCIEALHEIRNLNHAAYSKAYLLRECIEALHEIENLNHAAYSKAMDKLKSEPSWRVVFLELPNNRKKDWVLTL